MPTEIKNCVLCGRSTRGAAKRLCMVIKIDEQERRIKQGYERRWKKEIAVSIMGERVHRICYRSIIQHEPLAAARASSMPHKTNRKSEREQSSTPSLHLSSPSNSTGHIDEIAILSDDQPRFDTPTTCPPDADLIPFERSMDFDFDDENFDFDNEISFTQEKSSFQCSTLSTTSDRVPFGNITNLSMVNSRSIEPTNSDVSHVNLDKERSSSAVTDRTKSHRQSNRLLESMVHERQQQRRRPRSSHRIFLSTSPCRTRDFNPSDPRSRLFSNGFDELCAWLFKLLYDGFIIPMTEISIEYKIILDRRKEFFTECMTRTANIRSRLETHYGSKLHFEKSSNYDGVMVALADVSMYVQLAMSKDNVWRRPIQQDEAHDRRDCEDIMVAIEKIRQSIQRNMFYFRNLKKDRLSITSFDQELFWQCVPLLLRNFVGLVTASEEKFQKIKKDYGFYDLLEKDLFIGSSKHLKIASISYDLIRARDEKVITPKHLLLANELFHHTRSANLLKVTNRLGHSCSYDTVRRLHQTAADRARHSSDQFDFIQEKKRSYNHHFIIKVADNFDLNPDGVRGNTNNIHILNRILIKTPENDEIPIIVAQIVDNLMYDVMKLLGEPLVPIDSAANISSVPPTISNATIPQLCFIEKSFSNILLGYSLAKLFTSSSITKSFPLLSGFLASYWMLEQKPIHYVAFLTPINDNPSSESTAETCLSSTKQILLDSHHQNEAVLVVDEKIYRSCMKVKRRNPDDFQQITIYAGDFHLMKNTMNVIWDVMEGSGIEDILGLLYKGASLKSILNVHHFNKSLRCCKLLHTTLMILLMESFLADGSGDFDGIESILMELPNAFSTKEVKQKWFRDLLGKLDEADFHRHFESWCQSSEQKSSSFRLWSFITFSLLEPLMELYMAIRTGNFPARNAALARIAPLFFSTNHRNYARLCAQHMVDLKRATPYLIERLSRGFAVNRTNRPFSYIALDQTIECTINKFGKSCGGIDGRFDDETIDRWVNSFAFRALASSTIHEICELETSSNSIDSHVECHPDRQAFDHADLMVLVKALRSENLFDQENQQCRKLRSGLIFHDDIIENICTLRERGVDALKKYIDERLTDRVDKVNIDAPLPAMTRLKFIDGNSYGTGEKKSQPKNLAKIIKEGDEELRRVIVIAQQRQLPLSEFLSHEFAPSSFALCDSKSIDLLNQQSKAAVVNLIRDMYPSAFQLTCPTSINKSAIVVDGGSLLEMKPLPTSRTIRDYAQQLLKFIIGSLFKEHSRIDIVFDSTASKMVKMFIKRHENDYDNKGYQLQGSDKLQTPFSSFVHSNRAAVALCVRQCWSEQSALSLIPSGCLLVVSGPDESAIKLQNGALPTYENLLESNHVEADTRMLLHLNAIKMDGQHKTVVIQSNDTDVFLLTIALGTSVGFDNVWVKLFDTRSKKLTFVDAKSIANDLKRRLKTDPIILLILHGLSGCDTTSFIRGITKRKFFSTFFDNPAAYSKLIRFASSSPTKEAIKSAEMLLIDCYPSRYFAQSLDELRANVANSFFKDRGRKSIVTNLPPSSTAFHYHCLRAFRQIFTWISSFDQFIKLPPMESCGYQRLTTSNQLKIHWTSLPNFPDDLRLVTCGECSTGCCRCKCAMNKLPCTYFCRCKSDVCRNRSTIQMSRLFSNSTAIRDEDDTDDLGPQAITSLSSTSGSGDESDSSGASLIINSNAFDVDPDPPNGSILSDDRVSLSSSNSNERTNISTIELVNLDHSYCTSSSDGEEVASDSHRRKIFDDCPSSPVTPFPTRNSFTRITTNDRISSTPSDESSQPFRTPRTRRCFRKNFRAPSIERKK